MGNEENHSSAILKDVTVAMSDPSTAESSDNVSAETPQNSPRRGLKVLFLSSDTGGGHRASSEALGKQFQMLFPGTTYDLLDVFDKNGVPPYSSLVRNYDHLSGHPLLWKLIYSIGNSRAIEILADAHLKLMCERGVRESIQSYNPDVVVSVHPLMTIVPVLSCSKISQSTGKHLPIFTVVTDLGAAPSYWFTNGVEKMFVGSETIKELAKSRGKVPEEKLVLAGLPIRYDFSVQSENMGDRWSAAGKAYQRTVREELKLPHTDRKTILLVGGGGGVGSISNIADAVYVELVSQGIDALMLVVCGRNEKLREKLEQRDWNALVQRWQAAKDRAGNASSTLMSLSDACGTAATAAGCDGVFTSKIRRMLVNKSPGNAIQFPLPGGYDTDEAKDEKKAQMEDASLQIKNSIVESVSSADNSVALVESLDGKAGNVTVVGLGFVTQMAEYMVAADILVSKAGPGTISEAAALSLPILLTSFLPGQEEGNADYVINAGFGAYCHDSDPIGIAEEICLWLKDEDKLVKLSTAAKSMGEPYAARDIAKSIGESTLKWIDLNEERANPEAREKA